MFKKVLIADDLISVNSGVETLLNELYIPQITKVQYCDDAYLKIIEAYKNGQAYDLFITDLSFIPDHRTQKIISGKQLVVILKKEFPKLKIIVYTVEDKAGLADNLINIQHINGYVSKGRNGLAELKEAIKQVAKDKTYISPAIQQIITGSASKNITHNDIVLLQLLSQGMPQSQISNYFKTHQLSPSSLSAIEKQLNRLRDYFGAKNATHLVSIAKDLGLL